MSYLIENMIHLVKVRVRDPEERQVGSEWSKLEVIAVREIVAELDCLRAENDRLRKALEEVTAWLADPKLGYWTYIENDDFYTDRHLFLDRARQALEGKA